MDKVAISMKAKKELLWWKGHLTLCNGRSSISSPPQIIISSDASLQGWEASCKRPDNREIMIRGGTKVSHKCLEAQSSQNTYNVLHIKGKGCNISSHAHGQHDSPVILN